MNLGSLPFTGKRTSCDTLLGFSSGTSCRDGMGSCVCQTFNGCATWLDSARETHARKVIIIIKYCTMSWGGYTPPTSPVGEGCKRVLLRTYCHRGGSHLLGRLLLQAIICKFTLLNDFEFKIIMELKKKTLKNFVMWLSNTKYQIVFLIKMK